MKTCPKCNRTFPDEGQKFCTFDGGLLIAPQTFDPNQTIRATSIDLNAASERPTSRDLPDPSATIIERDPAETVALPRNTGPTGQPTTTSGPDTADFTQPAAPAPPVPAPPPPAPEPPAASAPPPSSSAPVPPPPSATPPPPPPPSPAPPVSQAELVQTGPVTPPKTVAPPPPPPAQTGP